jgi:hypothetical protein
VSQGPPTIRARGNTYRDWLRQRGWDPDHVPLLVAEFLGISFLAQMKPGASQQEAAHASRR